MKNMKFYELDFNGRTIKVAPIIRKYMFGDGLAIELVTEEFEPFDTLTTNLSTKEPSNDNCAFVNTNTYYDVNKFLLDNKLGFPTFNREASGFNYYFEFYFDLEKLNDGKDYDQLMEQLHDLYDLYDENPSALNLHQINMLKSYNVI